MKVEKKVTYIFEKDDVARLKNMLSSMCSNMNGVYCLRKGINYSECEACPFGGSNRTASAEKIMKALGIETEV